MSNLLWEVCKNQHRRQSHYWKLNEKRCQGLRQLKWPKLPWIPFSKCLSNSMVRSCFYCSLNNSLLQEKISIKICMVPKQRRCSRSIWWIRDLQYTRLMRNSGKIIEVITFLWITIGEMNHICFAGSVSKNGDFSLFFVRNLEITIFLSR